MKRAAIHNARHWLQLLAGLTIAFGLFHWSALSLGSDRGQAGVLVCALVVGALIAVERAFFSASLRGAMSALGFGRPKALGLAVALAVCAALLLVVPMYSWATGVAFTFWPGWAALVPGFLTQAGIAEEALFRGYLFGHLRQGRSFWRAALLSMLPFAAVHLLIFTTNPWPIAIAALALSVVLSIPFAHLFELGGFTILPPALVHAIIQGTVKIVVFPDDAANAFAIIWMSASAILGLLILFIRRR